MSAWSHHVTKWIAISSLILLLCTLAALSLGEIRILPWTWFSMEPHSMEYVILTRLRLPRTLTAVCVGGMLSMAGCIMQGLFKNPLVEPYTLGISGGAALGVSISFVTGFVQAVGFPGISACAFLGSLAVGLILLLYHRYHTGIENLLLIGIMAGILCASGTTLLMSLSSPENMTQIIYWTMGSLENSSGNTFTLIVFAFGSLFLGTVLSQRVNLLSMGKKSARHLGVNTGILIPVLLIFASLLTAVSVAQAGIIGFVGLVVPHILRRTSGTDYRLLIPLSFICGGIFLLFCDMIARIVISPSQLPIGVVSGILGGGLFVGILLKSKTERYA